MDYNSIYFNWSIFSLSLHVIRKLEYASSSELGDFNAQIAETSVAKPESFSQNYPQPEDDTSPTCLSSASEDWTSTSILTYVTRKTFQWIHFYRCNYLCCKFHHWSTTRYTDPLNTNTFIKRFSQGLRNSFAQVCKIIALNFYIFPVLLAACCSRKVENRDHAQSAHVSFSRYSVIVHLGNTFVPRKSLCFSLLSSFSGVEITKRGKCSWGVYGYSTLKMITR